MEEQYKRKTAEAGGVEYARKVVMRRKGDDGEYSPRDVCVCFCFGKGQV